MLLSPQSDLRCTDIDGRFSHAYHIADLHIRRTDERASEYAHVFDELLSFLRSRRPVCEARAIVVIAGDVFEDKRALDAYAESTFVSLMRKLTDLAPVVLIPGNHDFAQTEPERADRISHSLAIMMTCGSTAHGVAYLRDSGAYRVGNLCVCTASAYDALSSTSGSGNVDRLPTFPRGIQSGGVEHIIALAHTTVRTGMPHESATRGCTLAWFREAGHRTVMLGDEHIPRVWRQGGMVAAQPGSLLTQTFGEQLQGHGVCEWDLGANDVAHHELANPCAGVSAVRSRDGAIVFRTQGRSQALTGLVTAETARCDPDFPKTPRVRMLGDVKEAEVRRALEPEVSPSTCVVHAIASAEEWLHASGSSGRIRAQCSDLRDYTSKDRMAQYVKVNAEDTASGEALAQMLMDPETALALPSYPDAPTAVRAALVEHQSGSKSRKECVDEALRAFGQCSAPQHPQVALVRLEADNVTAYERLDMKLDSLALTTLVDGPNGTGKSSMLDVLKVALYGIDGVCENRQEFDTRKTGAKAQRESVKSYNVVNSSKRAGTSARTRLSVRVRKSDDAAPEDFCIERTFAADRDLKPRVRRGTSGAGTEVCSGVKDVLAWVSRAFGDSSHASMCAILAQSRATSFMAKRASARKTLIEGELSLDAIAHMGRALECNTKGRMAALKALEAVLQDRSQTGVRPARVSQEERSLTEDKIEAHEQAARELEGARQSLLQSMHDMRAAMAAHKMAPQPTDALESERDGAERALLACTPLTDTEERELADAERRARDLDLALARLGPEPSEVEADVARTKQELEGAEGALAEAQADPASPSVADASGHLEEARQTIRRSSDAATAILLPHLPRPDRTVEPERKSLASGAARRAVDDLQDEIRSMPARSPAGLLQEWRSEKAEWDELLQRAGTTSLQHAAQQLGEAQQREELPERQTRLVQELGGRSELEFDPGCAQCCSNRELLACAGLHEELAGVRAELASTPTGGLSVQDASTILRDVEDRERKQGDIDRRAANWEEALANDQELTRLESELASVWWGAYDAQADAHASAQNAQLRCTRILDLQSQLLAAREAHQDAARAAEDAHAKQVERDNLEARKSALQERSAVLLCKRSQLHDAREHVASAQDRVLYAELVSLEERAKDSARTLADLQAERTLQLKVGKDCEAWDQRDARLREIQTHLSKNQDLVDKALELIVGRPGRRSYSAHVYNDIVLPRIQDGMNRFLEQTATFQVVCVGNKDLEVRFNGADANLDLNQLGGADRFLLELAARCALRQIATPGFNWPIAFVDEGFVAFDASRRFQIAPILAAMVTVGGFEKLVLTSHLDSVKSVCMQTLSIERAGGVSRLVGYLSARKKHWEQLF